MYGGRLEMKKISRKTACLIITALLVVIVIGTYFCKSTYAKNNTMIPKSLEIKKGKSMKISVKKEKIRNKIKWSSDRKNVVTVSKKGIITAKNVGNAKITAKYKKDKWICNVKVVKAGEVPVETRKPAETINDPNWQTAKSSGSLEDFKKYFDVDMSLYEDKSVEHGTVSKITYHSKIYNKDREAYVYLPPKYNKEKKYPVVYMLHGIGCDGNQWVSMNAGGILDSLYSRKEAAPVIAVFPSIIPPDGLDKKTLSPKNIKAFTDFETEFSTDLKPYIYKNYAVSKDKKYTAICGLSMGGMEALCTGFTLKGQFNYIGSFSAAPTLNQSLLKIENKEDTPALVMLCSGDADGTVGDNPKNYHLELEKNGVDHIWYQYPSGGHSPEVWKNGLVNFMKRIF